MKLQIADCKFQTYSGFGRNLRFDLKSSIQSEILNLKPAIALRGQMPTVDELRRRYDDLSKRAADLRSFL
jgi:hypothetical protein